MEDSCFVWCSAIAIKVQKNKNIKIRDKVTERRRREILQESDIERYTEGDRERERER